MDFKDAMICLDKKEIMVRKNWDTHCSYLIRLPGMLHIWMINMRDQFVISDKWCPTMNDILADDWAKLSEL